MVLFFPFSFWKNLFSRFFCFVDSCPYNTAYWHFILWCLGSYPGPHTFKASVLLLDSTPSDTTSLHLVISQEFFENNLFLEMFSQVGNIVWGAPLFKWLVSCVFFPQQVWNCTFPAFLFFLCIELHLFLTHSVLFLLCFFSCDKNHYHTHTQ